MKAAMKVEAFKAAFMAALKVKKYVKTYSKLFRVDAVIHDDKFFIETPFTFIHWRMIEMLQDLC